jgi:hypothetical protein
LFADPKADDWEDIAFVRSTGQPGRSGTAWISAITEQFKLVYSTNEEPWLIDLKSDPNELTNLFGQPAHKEKSRWMTERLLAYGKANDDEYLSNPRIRSWVDQVLKSNRAAND